MRAAARRAVPARTPGTPARPCRFAAAPAPGSAPRSWRPGRRARASGSRSARATPALLDRTHGPLRFAHRLDDARTAVDGVAGGEDLRIRGLAVPVDALEQRAELLARPLADRLHDRVHRDDELAAGHRL